MSGITDNTATQAHDLVEQAEQEEQKARFPLCKNLHPYSSLDWNLFSIFSSSSTTVPIPDEHIYILTFLTCDTQVQGGDAITGQVEAGAVAPSAAESGQVDDQGQQQHKSKMEKVKEALHLKK